MSIYVEKSKKTKKLIQQSFLEILETQSFDTIKISDITNKANINRGTFYLHFEDKFDLMDEVRRQLNSKFIAFYKIDRSHRNSRTTVEEMCLHIYTYRTFYEIEFSNPESVQRLSNELALQLMRTFEDQDYAIFASYGTLGYLSSWAKNGFIMTPQEAAEKLLKIGFTDWSMISIRKYEESLFI